MHTVISFLYWPAILLALYDIDRWNLRPSARARWASLNLHDKIATQIRRLRAASALQTGFLVTFASLYAAGILSFGGWLAGTIASGIYLAADLYLLHHALAARRAYNALGPLTYLAEIKHAFGSLS
jgi:hypothetical protein